MKPFSALSLSSIVLACSMFVACNEEEDLVPQMEPAKIAPATPKQAPAPSQVKPAEEVKPADTAKPAEAVKPAEEPQLVPIQSLSATKEDAAKAEVAAAAPAASGSVKALDKGEYVIQVSIQASKKAADAIVTKLAENNVKAYIAEVENPGELEGTYYRIRVGYFASSADAQTYGKETLSPLNYAWWIDKSKNDEVGNPAGESRSYNDTMEEEEEEVVEIPASKPAPEPEPAPAPAPEPEPAPAPAPAAEPAPEVPATPAAPAPADDFDDWE